MGFDTRMLGRSGIGRYVGALLGEFGRLKSSKSFEFVLFVRDSELRCPDGVGSQQRLTSRVFSIREQFELPFRIAKARLDLMHSPQFNVSLLTKVPQVTTIHDCAYDRFPEEFSNRAARACYQLLFSRALAKSNHIIAVSHFTKRELGDLYGIEANKVTVIHHGVNETFFHEIAVGMVDGARIRYGIEEPFALYVGVTRPRKNLVRILRAFAEARRSLTSDVKLVLVGKEDTRFLDVKALARRLGIGDHVLQLGHVAEEDLPLLYKAARCLVFPSLYEGFGLPVLEAMAVGTPVLTGNLPSSLEVADRAALVVNPRNAHDIAEGMYRLFTERALRETLSEQGRKRAQMFRWDTCALKTLDVYGEMASAKH